jgi:hypothetical protein
MPLVINTPFKTNTVSNASGTAFVSNGTPFAASDVGRFIRLRTGPGNRQIRRIVGFVSTSQVTLDYPWTTSPHPEFEEVAPDAGDNWVMSYRLDDLDDGTNIVKVADDLYRFNFAGGNLVTLTSTAFVADLNIGLQLNSFHARIEDTACLQLGGIRADGTTYGGCILVDENTGNGGWSGSEGTNTGDIHLLGGNLFCKIAVGFWRFMHPIAAQRCTFQDLRVNGNWAGRFFGDKTVFRDVTIWNNQNTVVDVGSSFTVGPEVPVVKSIRIYDSGTAFYYSWSTPPNAGSLTVSGFEWENITRLFGTQGIPGAPRLLAFEDVDIDAVIALPQVANNGSASGLVTYRFANYLDAAFFDVNSDPVTDPVRAVTRDLQGVVVHDLVTSTGAIDRQSLIYRDSSGNFSGARNWEAMGGIVRAPYSFAAISYLLALSVQTLSMKRSVALNVALLPDLSITEIDRAVVDAYTDINNPYRLYDRAKSHLVANYVGQAATLVSRSGNLIDAGNFNVTIDATAASAFAFDGTTITIKASTYTGDMTTTGIITLANGAQFIGTRTDANGTVAPPKVVSITGITAGSRLQIFNVNTATEIVNQIVAGTSYSTTYAEGTGYSEGDVVRVRLAYDSGATAKLPFSGQAVVGSNGWSLLAAQQNDAVYNGLGIDGSTVTEFVSDFPNVQVDINDPDGTTRVDRLYAWFVHEQSSEQGIRQWFNGIVPEDEANFRIITATLDLKLDNIAATGVTFTDGRRLYRDDNASPLVGSTTGGGSITLFSGKVYTSVVSTSSPVITGDISQVPAAVQSGMTAQGYTAARAEKIDDIDAIRANTNLIPAAL